MYQHSGSTCRWNIRLSVERMFGFVRIAFIIFFILFHTCVTNEHWYVRLVLIADHLICHGPCLVTMCDIWPVVGVSSMINGTCRTWPYWPSSAFVSNSSFNGAALAQSNVSNEDNLFAICFHSLSLSFSLTFVLRYYGSGSTIVVCCLPTFLILIEFLTLIVFSTYLSFCSYLNSNQITSIQEGTFNNLTTLTHL